MRSVYERPKVAACKVLVKAGELLAPLDVVGAVIQQAQNERARLDLSEYLTLENTRIAKKTQAELNRRRLLAAILAGRAQL